MRLASVLMIFSIVLVFAVALFLILFGYPMKLTGIITCMDEAGYSTPVGYDRNKCDVMIETKPHGQTYSLANNQLKDQIWNDMNTYVAISGFAKQRREPALSQFWILKIDTHVQFD